MTYAELANPEHTSAGLPRDAATASRRWRWQWPGTRTNWLLLILFVDLQLADVVSTNYALALPGVWEANPLMAISQAKLGTAWWLPKLAAIGLVALTVPWSRRRWPMIMIVVVSGGAVLLNLAHL
jgi:Domain of unknown function (DUF5658)